MASVNKVIIVGNLGRDPELRYNPNGGAWCTVSIATTRNWKDKTTGEKVEETEWHRVVFNDRLAEIAADYLTKGRSVYIEGRLKTRKWTDKDGFEKFTTEIIASEMQMLGGREGTRGGEDRQEERSAPPARQAANKPEPKSATSFDDMDDDIPFISSCMSHDFAVPTERRMRKYQF